MGDLLTDAELCDLLRISRSTLLRHLRDASDWTKHVQMVMVGDKRRWLKASVLEFITEARRT